ncbi:flavoprotein NADH-dependent oxidoreductase [Coprinopsis sp. MPI-PUGE-AT-0042]|nr:flavoprotein NADH-dependent oxidoreductase [Coprinopsis sp. MPI-PUGE-AT-0042]
MAVAATTDVDVFFEPLQVGGITVPNRIQMTALTRNRAPNAVPTETMKEYYVQRARGGAGLIVNEGTLITRQGAEWENAPGIWSEEQVQAWKKITDAVHAEGSAIYAQLWHLGRVAHPNLPQQKLAGTPVYGPSAIAARGGKFRTLPGEPGYVTPTAIDDPRSFVEQFRHAAVNAKAAGFDGVELQGASGYLVTQFLDNTANKRTDEWGGSIENRARFALEVLKALKDVYGNNVALKLSPCGGYNDVGMPLEETLETFRYLISEADKLGLAYITLLRYNPMHDLEFDGKLRATQHDVFAYYREYIKNAKFYLNGGVTPSEGAELLSGGKIDGVAFGYFWVTHPDVGSRIKHNKPFDNVPDFATMQATKGPEDQWHLGYTDYPAAILVEA